MVSIRPTNFELTTLGGFNKTTHTDGLEELFSGQALELYWKFHKQCPSMSDYLVMIDKKTGGFFRVAMQVIAAEASSPIPGDSNLAHFISLLGRYYQVRDDYQNLVSDEVSSQYNGFATAVFWI